MKKDTILIPGSSNIPLAKKVANLSNFKLGKVEIENFADGETYIKILDNLTSKDVYIFQSCAHEPNNYLIELLMLIDAASDLQPRSINLTIPFYPYRRQNKKFGKGESAAAKLVSNLLEIKKIKKLYLCDIHSDKILTFFRTTSNNIETTSLFAEYFNKKVDNFYDYLVISPDYGARTRSKKLAKQLGLKTVVIEKYRPKHDVSKIKNIAGIIKNKSVIIIDDEINTGGTIINTANELKKRGAKNVSVAVTHGIFSKDSTSRINQSPIDEVVLTDTIKQPKLPKKFKILSIAKLIAENIK